MTDSKNLSISFSSAKTNLIQKWPLNLLAYSVKQSGWLAVQVYKRKGFLWFKIWQTPVGAPSYLTVMWQHLSGCWWTGLQWSCLCFLFLFFVFIFSSGEIAHIKEVNQSSAVLLKGSPCSMEADSNHYTYFVAHWLPDSEDSRTRCCMSKDLTCFLLCILRHYRLRGTL